MALISNRVTAMTGEWVTSQAFGEGSQELDRGTRFDFVSTKLNESSNTK